MENNRLGGPQGGPRPGAFVTRITGVAGAIVGLLILSALLAFGFMVSLVVIPVILVVGAIVAGYLWFKTRGIRKELKEQMQAYREQMPGSRPTDVSGGFPSGFPGNKGGRVPPDAGTVIDGDEFIHERKSEATSKDN